MRERRGQIGGLELTWLEAPSGDRTPVLYLHGVPSDGDDFLPFLGRTGGLAPDLPGFGRSDKPAAFDYSIDGYGRFLEAFVADRALERFSLVLHDWGAVGLALAQAMPERVERLVLIDAVPFLPGYRWHRVARIWRTPVLGELFMGAARPRSARRLSRAASGDGNPLPREMLDRNWSRFDHGTQRAILKLYRSAGSDVLARAGARLGELRCPALVIWGEREAYLPPALAQRYADALGGPSTVHVVEGGGHWPWVDVPEVVDHVAAFLSK